jgi:hypothetical protein
MPVTARLSRRFYETFGDEIADELVGWFNAVDDAYRSEFRELFEVHFARFDAKLEQRVAELSAKLEQRVAELRAETGVRFGRVEGRIDQLEVKVEQRLAEVRAGLIKWMFVFWAGSVAATIGVGGGAVLILGR